MTALMFFLLLRGWCIPNKSRGRYLVRALTIAVFTSVLASGLPFIPNPLVRPAAALVEGPIVSVSDTGAQGNSGSYEVDVSGDGRFAVFASNATNLVPGDTNGRDDVFIRDLSNYTTSLVSVGSAGEPANNVSYAPSTSDDGRYVVFASHATNLVSGDTNGVIDIFVRDRILGTTSRVSVASDGSQANDISSLGGNGSHVGLSKSISTDGRYVTFYSYATNLVSADTNGVRDAFVHDRATGQTTRVSLSSGGQEGNAAQPCVCHLPGSADPTISGDGRYVAFYSESSNLVSGDTNDKIDIFVHDRTTSVTERVSITSSEEQNPFWDSWDPAISANGLYVAFYSAFTSNGGGIHVRDIQAGTTTQITSGGASASISGDGRYIAYEASPLPGEPQFVEVYDQLTGTKTAISISVSGATPTDDAWDPVISADGTFILFESSASNLVTGDSNNNQDIFLAYNVASAPVDRLYAGCYEGIHAANPSACDGDEVNTAIGSFSRSDVDAKMPGIGVPFQFERRYSSSALTEGTFGYGWRHTFGAFLEILPNGDVRVHGEDLQRVLFPKQADGSFLKPSGATSSLARLGDVYELKTREQMRYRFDSSGRLSELKERNGQGLTFSYDVNGRMDRITDGVGRLVTLTYHPSGYLASLGLPDGRTVTYNYTAGLLTSVTDMRGKTKTYSYDAAGRLQSILDANNHEEVRNTYDPTSGRITEQLDALGKRTTFSWDSPTQTSSKTDPRGKVWRDVYSQNVLVKRIDPLGNTTVYKHDSRHNVVGTTDPRGNFSETQYDAQGNVLKTIDPAPFSHEEIFTYDSMNNVTSKRDRRGNTTTFEYDTAGNLIKKTEPGSFVTLYGRDPGGTGLLVSQTDPRGKTSTFEYTQGNVTKSTKPLGGVATMTYDITGRLLSTVEPRGNVLGANPDEYRTTLTYDNADHILTQTDPLGRTTTFGYDDVGNKTSVTDAKLRITGLRYDAANRMDRVTAPDTTTTNYGFDDNGNLITRTDAKMRVTTYEYDDANRLTGLVSPTGQRWSYQYDAAGNRTKVTDANGNSTAGDPSDGITTYTYDELNRRTRLDFSDSTPDVQFTYDPNGNRASMIDVSGTETYTYDLRNLLTQVARGIQTFSYQYDAVGNVSKRTYPDATVVDYTYDDDGRMATAVKGTATTSYGSDAAGNLITTTLPASNGHIEQRIYDRAGRLTEVRNTKGGTTLSFATYTLDEVGNPNSVVTDLETVNYKYDLLDRLTEACFNGSCDSATDYIRYTYDEIGNRKTEVRPGGTTTYDYNNADWLLSQAGPSGTVANSYDQNGSQTASGAKTFTYDLSGRTKTATAGGVTTTYIYDGDGKRLQASTGTQASKKTNYIWDKNSSLPQVALERDGNNALLRRYVYGSDLISMTSGNADYFFHYGQLGSVVNVTNASGAKQWTYTYEPFGSMRSEVKNNTKAPTNLMRFTGELYDTQTGLYHLRARQYDPAIGRFTQTDPVPPPLTDPYVSSYAYVGNRCTVLTDPSGEIAQGPSIPKCGGPPIRKYGAEARMKKIAPRAGDPQGAVRWDVKLSATGGRKAFATDTWIRLTSAGRPTAQGRSRGGRGVPPLSRTYTAHTSIGVQPGSVIYVKGRIEFAYNNWTDAAIYGVSSVDAVGRCIA